MCEDCHSQLGWQRLPLRKADKAVTFRVANGTEIPSQGTKTLSVKHSSGTRRLVKPHVTQVKKSLLSVSEMVDSDHKVVFEKTKTTKAQRLQQKRDYYHKAKSECLPSPSALLE